MQQRTLTLITAVLLSLLCAAAHASKPEQSPPQETQVTHQVASATQQLKGTLDAILAVLLDPDMRTEHNTQQRIQTVNNLFRESFDEHTFCRRALGRHWNARTEEERKQFVELFTEVIVSTYLERVDTYLTDTTSFSHDNITYLEERETPAYTLVSTEVMVDTVNKIPVLYRMERKNETWLVTDIAIEGISLLRNYRTQFNEIISNAGYAELLKRLQARQV